MSTSASSTNGSSLKSRLSHALWLWWSVSNFVDAGVDDVLGELVGVLRRVADRVLGAVVSLPVTVWSLSWIVAVATLPFVELTRVAIERELLGPSPFVSARTPKKAATTATTTTTITRLRRCLGTDTPRTRRQPEQSTCSSGRPFRAVRCRRRAVQTGSGPAYSAM